MTALEVALIGGAAGAVVGSLVPLTGWLIAPWLGERRARREAFRG